MAMTIPCGHVRTRWWRGILEPIVAQVGTRSKRPCNDPVEAGEESDLLVRGNRIADGSAVGEVREDERDPTLVAGRCIAEGTR